MAENVGLADPPLRWGRCALGLLFVSAVAAVLWLRFEGGIFCTSEVHTGATLHDGLYVAFFGGLGGALVLLILRRRPLLCAAVVLVAAAALGVALAFVTVDSARYVAVQDCGLFGSGDVRHVNEHLYYLYVLWGLPLGYLFWSALRTLRWWASESSPERIRWWQREP